jgi:hypothetical protein
LQPAWLGDSLEVGQGNRGRLACGEALVDEDLGFVFVQQVGPRLAAYGLVEPRGKPALQLPGELAGHALAADLLRPALTLGVDPADRPGTPLLAKLLLLAVILKGPGPHNQSAWLDFGPATPVLELREGSPNVTVVLEEDWQALKDGKKTLAEVALPMPVPPARRGGKPSEWQVGEFNGVPVARKDAIDYNPERGARWAR